MGNAKTILAGSNSEAHYLAFGDDSQFGDTIVYAFVVVPRTRIKSVEARIDALKQRFKIPNETTLHCRELFSGHQRQKAGLGHLTRFEVQSIVARAITIMNQTPILIRYAVASLSELGSALGDKLELQHESDGTTIEVPVKMDAKGLQGFLMQSCFAVPPDRSGGPTAADCQIFVSEDPTKVMFIGKKRSRADGLYAGFSDIGAPSGNVFQLQPTIISADSEPTLQLADIAAYVCSHAHDTALASQFF